MPKNILEIQHVREALNDIHYDTWLILDLDNTVMTPRLELGSDSWFGGLFEHFVKKNIDPALAKPWVFSVYDAVQHFIRTASVEPEIIIIIKALQDIGIPVIGLTARGYSIRHQTMRQLADIDVDFSRNSIAKDDGVFCAGGVIYCDGKNKGKILEQFFTQQGHLPRHVGMLDDKKKNLEHVMSALQPSGVNFSGFRYAYLDEQVEQFDMAMANLQLAHLWQWLPTAVQDDIKNLGLISEYHQAELSPFEFKDDFFHPNQPLYQPNDALDDVTDVGKATLFMRSMSSVSFFQYNSQTEALVPKAGGKRKREDEQKSDVATYSSEKFRIENQEKSQPDSSASRVFAIPQRPSSASLFCQSSQDVLRKSGVTKESAFTLNT